jgi:hypothetical protein
VATIVVSGALANRCFNGGGAWVRLNWLLGLRRLGHAVYFVEEIGRQTCVNASRAVTTFWDSLNRAYFRQVIQGFGLSGASTLVYEGEEQTDGLCFRELLDLAASADLLVNLGGHLASVPMLSRFHRKAYIDLDPGYTQFWQAAGNPGSRLEGHDYYFSVGANVGTPDCPIPTCGVRWQPIRPPVVLEQWPGSAASAGGRFTTVASWRGAYGPVELGGKRLGPKAHEFRRFLDLPARSGQAFEVALSIHPSDGKDLDALRRHGWHIADPAVVAADPEAFRRYIRASGAEFSAAQGVYVETASGWFSDRTAEYLAAGKPVLVQDTGFGRHYPIGDGLLTFRTPDEAAAGARAIVRDYDKHARAARAIAEDFFDSDKVLGRFLDEVGIGS